MKKFLLAGFVVFSASLSGTALADVSKIGVVNFQEVVQKSPDYEALKTKLEKQFTPKQKKMMDGQKELQKKVEDLRRNDAVMKEEDKKKLQEEIIKKQQELQAMEVNFQKEYVAEQEKAFQELVAKLKAKVVTVAEQEKLDMILAKDAVPFTKGPDVTQKVIDALKK